MLRRCWEHVECVILSLAMVLDFVRTVKSNVLCECVRFVTAFDTGNVNAHICVNKSRIIRIPANVPGDLKHVRVATSP